MGEPVIAVAAEVAAEAYSASVENKAAKIQQIGEDAATTLNTAQAQAAAAQTGARNARSFRSALAQQVAIAGRRGTGGSLIRQFSSESVHNFLQDQEAIKQGIRTQGIQAQNQFAQSAAKRSAVRMRGFANVVQSYVSAAALNAATSGAPGVDNPLIIREGITPGPAINQIPAGSTFKFNPTF